MDERDEQLYSIFYEHLLFWKSTSDSHKYLISLTKKIIS